jgi:hypothetical protein
LCVCWRHEVLGLLRQRLHELGGGQKAIVVPGGGGERLFKVVSDRVRVLTRPHSKWVWYARGYHLH